MTAPAPHRFVLGGQDLEMLTIRQLLDAAGLAGFTTDHNLPWGARASAYDAEIRASLKRGEKPVLVELASDLAADIDPARLILVDHHGARAGAQAPSSLRQVFDLIAPGRALSWTRWHALVEANDIGHAQGLRALGANADEVRKVRDADRRAQGIGAAVETESRRALAGLAWHGGLAVVSTDAPTSSAIADFALPEYGGPQLEDLLVLMPDKAAFFGNGAVVLALARAPAWKSLCWHGGALPARGFWGAPLVSRQAGEALIGEVAGILREIQAKH